MIRWFLLPLFVISWSIWGQTELELLDATDLDVLQKDDQKVSPVSDEQLDLSEIEEMDDLESLKSDVTDIIYDKEEEKEKKEQEEKQQAALPQQAPAVSEQSSEQKADAKPEIFDVGAEEKKLLELSKYVVSKIPDKEWDEISVAAKDEKYVVQTDDWLWKISKRFFGTGFYYSKIWSLNPYITNPHKIEPGMTIVFSTGDETTMPSVRLGEFREEEGAIMGQKKSDGMFEFGEFGDGDAPTWLQERNGLLKQGVYLQYSSEATYDDLIEQSKKNLNTEYRSYDPPVNEINIQPPEEQYDSSGFDKSSHLRFNFNEGYFLNSFVTSNIVLDLGSIEAAVNERIFINKYDHIYVELNDSTKAKPGDKFSIYSADGKVKHQMSDREGYQYTINGQIELLRKINHLWECKVTELSGLVRRGDRVTTYTAKINKIVKTFTKRKVEAIIIKSYRDSSYGLSFGDVVYLDRGRADGVEMGNVFMVYSFSDRGTEKAITPDPTYQIGELTVISLTDNFSTALITQSSVEIPVGTLALSKTTEEAARDSRIKSNYVLKDVMKLEKDVLDELDIELNLDDIGESLLDNVDKVQLTEDELEELERQEREKSVIKDHDADLKELERLEKEIVDAETQLNSGKVDEDKYLEQHDLDNVEKNQQKKDPNAFESLNEIEEEVGTKYMDQDLNAKENPYGLTEFDLEEIDELLNTDSK